MLRKAIATIGTLAVLPYLVIYYMIKIPVYAAIGTVLGIVDSWKNPES